MFAAATKSVKNHLSKMLLKVEEDMKNETE
jgi:hypothetical protein